MISPNLQFKFLVKLIDLLDQYAYLEVTSHFLGRRLALNLDTLGFDVHPLVQLAMVRGVDFQIPGGDL